MVISAILSISAFLDVDHISGTECTDNRVSYIPRSSATISKMFGGCCAFICWPTLPTLMRGLDG